MTIDRFIEGLSRLDGEARALAAGVSEAQAHWQPDGGAKWSITQNLQHLARTNEIYVAAMRAGLAGAPKAAPVADLEAVPTALGRWFVRMMEPPPRFRVKTRRAVQPASTGSLAEALESFLRSQEAVGAFAREAAVHNLATTFKSPFGPIRPRIATGLLVIAAHDRRHLWQARQVMLADGFPKERP